MSPWLLRKPRRSCRRSAGGRPRHREPLRAPATRLPLPAPGRFETLLLFALRENSQPDHTLSGDCSLLDQRVNGIDAVEQILVKTNAGEVDTPLFFQEHNHIHHVDGLQSAAENQRIAIV